MSKGKQVKPLPTPGLNQQLSLKLIGEAIRARSTQQMLDENCCNVSIVTLSKIENGSPGVRLYSVLKAMSALGIHIHIEPWDSDARKD